MNKYSIIAIIAIIVIVIPIVYGLWGIYSVGQLELRKTNVEFSYFEMSNSGKIQICNPMPFFVSFNGVKIESYYQNDLKGSFEIGPTTIQPKTSEIIDLQFTSENFAESQYLFMHMDGQFDGELPIRLDPNKMVMATIFETRIMGIIPYQTTILEPSFDFTQKMNSDSSCENSV